MSSRTRKGRKRTRRDSAALGRVTAAARRDPRSPTGRTGFAARAVEGLYPLVPGWCAAPAGTQAWQEMPPALIPLLAPRHRR
ncbi:hypothetical protein OH799_06050 [Nocardia sp. NBC_00881]|uniref:hypothetical protein n=1 Tax=Nocardia sp. NBC_00881 TaxID=2975995 RepID=UPI003867663F|nr:hypothetical protein OH799_06050 [Nocardia sp. NBC_00881]